MTEGESIESRAPEKPTTSLSSPDRPARLPRDISTSRDDANGSAAQPVEPRVSSRWQDPLIEKPGTMRVVDKNNAFSEPVRNVPAVAAIGQEGLLDVALDPAFTTNRRIFIHLQRSCR
jgi:glucose/arabinose dehydrogenase